MGCCIVSVPLGRGLDTLHVRDHVSDFFRYWRFAKMESASELRSMIFLLSYVPIYIATRASTTLSVVITISRLDSLLLTYINRSQRPLLAIRVLIMRHWSILNVCGTLAEL